jgi:hypothetical protein
MTRTEKKKNMAALDSAISLLHFAFVTIFAGFVCCWWIRCCSPKHWYLCQHSDSIQKAVQHAKALDWLRNFESKQP